MRYGLGKTRWIIPAAVVAVLGGAMALPAADQPSGNAPRAATTALAPSPQSTHEVADASFDAGTPEQQLVEQLRAMAMVEGPEEPVIALAVARAPVVEPRPAGPPEPDATSFETARVEAGALNVRSGPTTSAAALGRIVRGTVVEIHGSEGNWKEIATADGISGWVHGSYLAPADRV